MFPSLQRPAPPAQSSEGQTQAPKESKEGSEVGYFDPSGLERGAAALREIDQSGRSEWAFQLASMQEKTAQLAGHVEIEKQRAQLAQLEAQMGSVEAEESRKTLSHMSEEERNSAQHKAQIESALQARKLELDKEALEYKLNRENELFTQHESIRLANEHQLEEAARETMRRKAAFDRECAVSAAHADAEGRAQQERENIEIRLRELRAQHAEERSTRLLAIEEVFSSLSSGARALYEDQSKMVATVAGFTMLSLGIYGARNATRVAASVLERRLGRPPLVRETSRWTWRPQLQQWPWLGKNRPNLFDNIVLEETLSERLQWTTNALMSAQENGTPFRHLLLHGAPGTGKTLFARTLARQSGLDYAIMSGGDMGPLGREGPNELHKLFKWAATSRKGLVLFVDEADAFLRSGRGAKSSMSEDARNALSVFLHHTGTESARVAVILATNVPAVLDRAVLDRIDEAFEFPIPAYNQRYLMLQMFVDRYVRKPTKRGLGIDVDPAINDDYLAEIAKRTDGFSGRQLAKLALAFQNAVFGSGTTRLTMNLAETVVSWRLSHPNS